MIPRFLRITYWILVSSIVLMAITLAISRHRDHQRILAMRDQSPIAAPSDIPSEDVSIAIPSDDDGSIHLDQKSLALPADPPMRAAFLLSTLFAELALPASTHPVPPGPAVTDVFFVPLPLRNPAAVATDEFASSTLSSSSSGIRLAVVNIAKVFADAHPSGIESEDLTLRAIIATLHANFPEISEVRFLVDGKPRDTLNGHADLSRSYPISDPAKSIHTQIQ